MSQRPANGFFLLTTSVRLRARFPITDNALRYRSRLGPVPRPIADCPARVRDLVRDSSPRPPDHPWQHPPATLQGRGRHCGLYLSIVGRFRRVFFLPSSSTTV